MPHRLAGPVVLLPLRLPQVEPQLLLPPPVERAERSLSLQVSAVLMAKVVQVLAEPVEISILFLAPAVLAILLERLAS